ncbi:hypothetical protein GM708_07555 [Vibrio cholerae]|nr:hypothetical protein [Vibrio cholerae]
MTYQPAPETPTTIIEWLSQLSTFHVDEFHGFLMISPLLPQSERAAA